MNVACDYEAPMQMLTTEKYIASGTTKLITGQVEMKEAVVRWTSKPRGHTTQNTLLKNMKKRDKPCVLIISVNVFNISQSLTHDEKNYGGNSTVFRWISLFAAIRRS